MTTADRLQLSPCPTWCQILHNEGDAGAQGHDGPSWPTVNVDDGSSVDVATVQDDAEHGVNLRAGQAREAGLALLAAAFWVHDHTT